MAEADPAADARREQFVESIRATFNEILRKVPDKQAKVFRLRALDPDREPLTMTHEEVAMRLGISPEAARQRWSRAWRRIGHLLRTVELPAPVEEFRDHLEKRARQRPTIETKSGRQPVRARKRDRGRRGESPSGRA